jgi:hypothetical protein
MRYETPEALVMHSLPRERGATPAVGANALKVRSSRWLAANDEALFYRSVLSRCSAAESDERQEGMFASGSRSKRPAPREADALSRHQGKNARGEKRPREQAIGFGPGTG